MTLKERLKGFLYRGEGIFKVDMRYILRGGFWTSVSFLASLCASIAAMVAFGNLLPKENYGTYNYLLSLASSLGFLTLSGIGPGVIRAVAKRQENLLPYALKLQLRYNLLAVATISAAAFYYYAKGNSLFAISLGILAVIIPLEAAYHIYEHILIGRKRFDTLAILSGFSSIGAAVATVLALLFTDNVLILVITYAATSLIPSYLAYRLITRNAPVDLPDQEEVQELRRSAFHITGAGIIGTLAQYADKLILFQVAGPVALATYGFAIAGPEKVKGLVKNWVNIALPRLAHRDISEIRYAFYKRLTLSALAGAGAALVYISLSPIFFRLLLPKYLDSILYSQAYALGLILVPALVYIGNIFYSQNMLRAIYITSTGNQIMRIAAFAVGGFLWGTWGLVFGFLFSQLLSLAFCIAIWEKESRRLSRLAKIDPLP